MNNVIRNYTNAISKAGLPLLAHDREVIYFLKYNKPRSYPSKRQALPFKSVPLI